jgi:hypothetical protein
VTLLDRWRASYFTYTPFAVGSHGSAAEGWFVPPGFEHYQVSWIDFPFAESRGCVVLKPGPCSGANPGNVMQTLDATPLRDKLVRYKAAVNTAPGATARLWLRVDRPGGQLGFFENMSARHIATDGTWDYFEIDGFVHADALAVSLGVLVYRGEVRFHNATFAITGSVPSECEAPRSFTASGLQNVLAFAKLFGLIRHFHPSDEAAAADWNTLACEGIRSVETAATQEELAQKLTSVFQQIAPTLYVYNGQVRPPAHPALSPSGNVQLIRWGHKRNKRYEPAKDAVFLSGFGQSSTRVIRKIGSIGGWSGEMERGKAHESDVHCFGEHPVFKPIGTGCRQRRRGPEVGGGKADRASPDQSEVLA